MILRRTALVVVHLAAAVALLAALVEQRRTREHAVADLRASADAEHRDTLRMEREHAVQQRLLAGLHESDPYVVELMARDRLGYARPGEIAPPPAPAASDDDHAVR
jgi:cell division protein FtsB